MTEFTFFNYRASIDYMRKYHCVIRYLFERYAHYVYDMFDGPVWKRIIEVEFIEYILFMWVLDEYDEKQMYWTEKLLGEKMFDPSSTEFNIVYRLFDNIIQHRIAVNENSKRINEIRTAGAAYDV
jgi:hypothetical protein